ncbi:MAG TPA: hypothetical protein VGF74_08465 [Thermoleophilaceae bacterium]|jgi:hypothetical protein
MLALADTMMTVFGVMLVAVMVSGYVVIWALWHFVFSKAPPDDPREQEPPAPDVS